MNTEGLKVPYTKHHFNHYKCPILNQRILTSDFFYSFEYVELGRVQSWSFSMLVTVNNSNKKAFRECKGFGSIIQIEIIQKWKIIKV